MTSSGQSRKRLSTTNERVRHIGRGPTTETYTRTPSRPPPLPHYMDITWAMGRSGIGLDRSRIGSTRDEPPAAAGPSPIMPATLKNRTDRTLASPSKSAGIEADGGPRGPAAMANFFLPPVPDSLHNDGSSPGEDAAGSASSSAIELRLLLLTDDPGPRARSLLPPPLSPPPPPLPLFGVGPP